MIGWNVRKLKALYSEGFLLRMKDEILLLQKRSERTYCTLCSTGKDLVVEVRGRIEVGHEVTRIMNKNTSDELKKVLSLII